MSAPLVLLHGLSDSGDCWPGVVAHVRDRRVLTPTALGHGGRPLPEEFAVSALGADTVATLRRELDGPAVVVGHSMGGLMAQEVALQAPELVAALVLVDPAWVGGDGLAPDWLVDVVAARDTPVEDLVAQSHRDEPAWPDDERGPWAAARSGLHPRLAEVPHAWAERDWPAVVGEVVRLGIPVTLVTGDPDRTIVTPPLVARALAAADVPGAARLTVVNLPGTGHSVHRDDRPGFLATLDTVLTTVDSPAP
ncbi:alpha/beta fold hydrolase [Cellulomonas fimi]|uniref:Alpha/beta hydrolase fold protein n=1 Tax=Cellulomonas fimi (strain ATCC 484 / DSM 20113 / JCM 1341 / CCUG 24087 / LMG 16345 / NBRC 15513 / NCIMB 8980 / NCTC 7547 / NRS-133) TaxID=590998 RepID=F4H123_CELFA|nr:alpha/beta hydrolase [Cellulomonas fimi]AEE47392.1 alpha/beta hydrolase fold protein [Cellulomonas fimi ATCC 484]NNH05778.1 alpha/beta fold hydrolase [Cellulomonas fimi]VEH36089.1 Tropinesterase [Cellulomonas fimi]